MHVERITHKGTEWDEICFIDDGGSKSIAMIYDRSSEREDEKIVIAGASLSLDSAISMIEVISLTLSEIKKGKYGD